MQRRARGAAIKDLGARMAIDYIRIFYDNPVLLFTTTS